MSEFKIGDVVQVKSGEGPKMNIESLGNYSETGGPSDGACCVWFDKNKKVTDVFDVACLKVASEEGDLLKALKDLAKQDKTQKD